MNKWHNPNPPVAVEESHDEANQLNPAVDPATVHPAGTEAAYPAAPVVNPDPPAGDAYRATPNVDWSSSNPPAYPAVDEPEAYDDHESIHEDVAAGLAQLEGSSAATVPGTYIHSAVVHFQRVLEKLKAGFSS